MWSNCSVYGFAIAIVNPVRANAIAVEKDRRDCRERILLRCEKQTRGSLDRSCRICLRVVAANCSQPIKIDCCFATHYEE